MRKGWRRACVLSLALCAGALACAQPTAPPPAERDPAGLARFPNSPRLGPHDTTGAPHLGELAIGDGAVWATNEWFAIATWNAADLAVTDGTPTEGARPRCTTLAVHAPSHTLYCSAADARQRLPPRDETVVAIYDVSQPLHPRLRGHTYLSGQMVARDLHVVGDELFVAGFADGLWRFRIAADGTPGELADLAVGGDVRSLAGEGDVLLALDRALGLRRFARAAGGWRETGRLALEGTARDLVLRGGRAVAALGSGGVAIVDVTGETPRLLRAVQPECAVTSADVQGSLLGVTCFGGALLYDLAADPPVARGFAPTQRPFLHGRFSGDAYYVSAWHGLEAFRVRADGEVRELELPPGAFTRTGDDVRLVVRNHGPRAMQTSLRLSGEVLPSVRVEGGATQEIVIPGDVLSRAVDGELRRATLRVGMRFDDETEQQERTRSVVLSLQDPAHREGEAFPAVGERSPRVQAVSFEGAPIDVPQDASGLWLVFYSEDCSAMWHELEDLAWLARKGLVPGGRMPLFIEHTPHAQAFVARWRLDGVLHGYYGGPAEGLPAGVAETNRAFGNDLHEGAFAARSIPEGIDNSTDVWLDPGGRVAFLGRTYRGRWSP